MNKRMKLTGILVLTGLAAGVLGCDTSGSHGSIVTVRHSFEGDLEGWSPAGTDLEHGDSTIVWSIEPSQERATHGSWSVRYTLDNMNDAGKIWLVKSFALVPLRTYRIGVEYDFASADFGAFNLFTIITGAAGSPPLSRDDLHHAYQGETGNGSQTDIGYRWLRKTYELTATADALGNVYVFVGIWGTWETKRVYFLDNLSLQFEER